MFKPLGKNILIKGETKTKTKSGLYMAGESKQMAAKTTLEGLEVIAIGAEVETIKAGDRVMANFIKVDSAMRNANQLFPDKKEEEFYVVVEEKDIFGMIE